MDRRDACAPRVGFAVVILVETFLVLVGMLSWPAGWNLESDGVVVGGGVAFVVVV